MTACPVGALRPEGTENAAHHARFQRHYDLVAGGLMLVGDAARQVDPPTGGGIINAMSAGQLAAQVAVESVAAGDASASFLSRYEEQWNQSVGRKMGMNP